MAVLHREGEATPRCSATKRAEWVEDMFLRAIKFIIWVCAPRLLTPPPELYRDPGICCPLYHLQTRPHCWAKVWTVTPVNQVGAKHKAQKMFLNEKVFMLGLWSLGKMLWINDLLLSVKLQSRLTKRIPTFFNKEKKCLHTDLKAPQGESFLNFLYGRTIIFNPLSHICFILYKFPLPILHLV